MTRTLGGLCRSEKRRTIAASCVPAQSTERLLLSSSAGGGSHSKADRCGDTVCIDSAFGYLLERLHGGTPRRERHRQAGARLISTVRQEATMRCRRTCPRRGTSLAGHHAHTPGARPAAFTPRSRDGHGLHEPDGRPGNP